MNLCYRSSHGAPLLMTMRVPPQPVGLPYTPPTDSHPQH